MHATLIALGIKLGDMPMWQRFFHSKIGLTVASLVLGLIGTLGFAPYQLWVLTLVTLGFEFFFLATLKSPKQAFWSLWLYFTALHAATLGWLNFVMHGFGQMPLPLSWLLEILLSAYLAFFHGLLGCLAFKLAHRYLKKKHTSKQQAPTAKKEQDKLEELDKQEELDELEEQDALKENLETNSQDSPHFYKNAFLLAFLPVALILADYISGWLFTGFPWMYVGYTALEGPFSAYAPLLGVRGITLILFICAGALALTLERRYVYLPVAGILFAIGIFCQGLNFTQNLPAIKVTGIQGNILQQIKWDPRQVLPIIDHYVNQTMPYFGKSDLIIWPESALPVFAQEIPELLQELNNISYTKQSPLLIGLQHADFGPDKHLETFNTIYLLGTSSQLSAAQIYKKRQLVPFGEQVPFEEYTRKLGSIFNFPMSGFTAGDYKQAQIHLTLTATHASSAQATLLDAGSIEQTNASSTVSTVSTQSAQANLSVQESEENTKNVANKQTQTLASTSAASSKDNSSLAVGQVGDATVSQVTDTKVSPKDNFIEENPTTKLITTKNASAHAPALSLKQNPSTLDNTQELAAGENAWFNSALPHFPNDKSIPLEQPLTLNFIPAICYESIFPELMTSLHDENTNGIIMISNDSWFGNTRGPDEHLAIARMRSMEMQKPMIRITNSGHTVLIDKTGKVVSALAQDQVAILHTDFVPNQGMTPFVRWHNIPLYLILLILCGLGWYLRKQEVNTMQQNLEALVRP